MSYTQIQQKQASNNKSAGKDASGGGAGSGRDCPLGFQADRLVTRLAALSFCRYSQRSAACLAGCEDPFGRWRAKRCGVGGDKGANELQSLCALCLWRARSPIGEDVRSLAQITPELLVGVCARSLLLISEGSLRFPAQLPAGIAARHRICTDMAAKIKELGYPGDCGYNQLLYPTEDSIRDILNWLMNRLPRSEEDRTEEVLGPNALLNRRIMGALENWRCAAWKMPFCFEGGSNVYRPLHRLQQLRTYPARQRPGAHYVVDKVSSRLGRRGEHVEIAKQ